MWWRILVIVLLSILLLSSISAFIVFSISIGDDLSHIHRNNCPVLLCINGSLIYQWPEPPYYKLFYNYSGTLSCRTTLPCGYDDRDLNNTLGGWLTVGHQTVCMNGACNIVVANSEWYLGFICCHRRARYRDYCLHDILMIYTLLKRISER